jgi:hypothetical protein
MALQNVYDSRLGGVMVSDLAIGPKVRWFKPGQGDGFLRTIEVRDTPFFGEEVKRSKAKSTFFSIFSCFDTR